MSRPILLLQWLLPGEYREARKALAEFAATVNIEYADVQTKSDARQAFDSWLMNNSGNCQFPYIGGHGVQDAAGKSIGIGASGDPNEYATWPEIWQWMDGGGISGGLWLGGCRSADAAAALSPLLGAATHTVMRYIVGFDDNITPDEIEAVLRQLINNTDINNIVDLAEELLLIRKAVPKTNVVMFHPAYTKKGKPEYVNVDEFEEKVGVTFDQFLSNGGG